MHKLTLNNRNIWSDAGDIITWSWAIFSRVKNLEQFHRLKWKQYFSQSAMAKYWDFFSYKFRKCQKFEAEMTLYWTVYL